MGQPSAQLRAEIVESLKLADWIGDTIENSSVPNTPRACNAMALYHVVFSHHSAVLVLFNHGFRLSALALLRPLLESFLRGNWVEVQASDKELNDFLAKDNSLKYEQLLAAAERLSDDNALSDLVRLLWVRLCSFTHSGAYLLNRNQDANTIGDLTTESDCMSAIYFSNSTAFLTLIHVLKLIDRNEILLQASEKYNEISERYEVYKKSTT
jgi:hypothetical protein